MSTEIGTAAQPMPPAGHTPPEERLQSLDILRGFDMFWISGESFNK